MVNPICYPTDGGRYNRLGPRFPGPFTERQRYHLSSEETRPSNMKAMGEREPEAESTPPRKRIALACARCRKRKIRCSGDPGNGLPCQNCKSAGAEPCQFLRVNATETAIFQNFGYDMDSARVFQARGSIASPFSPHYPPEMTDSLSRYHPPSSGYQYPSRYYSGVPSWPPAYGEDGVDYASFGYPHAYYGNDPTYLYRMASNAKAVSANGMYTGTDPTYNCVHRPPVSAETANFSLSTVAASLPSTIATNDKLLPTPVNRAVASHRGDYGSPKPSPEDSTQGSPSTAVTEMPGNYTGYDGPSVSTYHSSSGIPSSHRLSTSTSCGTDVYPSSSSGSSLFSESESGLRNQSSNSDLSYKYADSSRRGSGTSTLSNGYPYMIPQLPSSSAPLHSHHHVDHTHGVSAAAAYMMPGGGPTNTGATATTAEMSGATTGIGGSGGPSGVTGHADIQRRTAAGSLPAA
ncbi:hypothetical protein SODALDRAFT_198664 [Sodiomyces alkalinus F11]|uniref:Zn(2)-C6 fungal-type domain-containing protein n=1 Tax=Sodiomyces alkalinus (strain CBS 110278 / VKM F-3762 / F11) TaxID=1314773 RepID=A0A3N2PSP3_SODAK|nr:hypothetical protein SODALDRAFT_198664 [Sodiomyces alkalinus F11]ROT37500.1 hypothetical protein SODALDRAFT_198664 [Sodiomyces alkalinus F11]